MKPWIGLTEAEQTRELAATLNAVDGWPEWRRRAALRWLLGMVCDERGTHPDDIVEWMQEEFP